MLDGKKVKAARKDLGLTGRAFAKLVGVSPSTITKIEDNDYPGMGLEMAERIAEVLHRPLCLLLMAPPLPHHYFEGNLPQMN